MVLGRRKRRDTGPVGAWVTGVRRPGDKGSGQLAAGWESGHNRRRQPIEEPWEQPCRAEPSLAGTGSRGCWFPSKGGRDREAGAVGSLARAGGTERQASRGTPVDGQRCGGPVLGGLRARSPAALCSQGIDQEEQEVQAHPAGA